MSFKTVSCAHQLRNSGSPPPDPGGVDGVHAATRDEGVDIALRDPHVATEVHEADPALCH